MSTEIQEAEGVNAAGVTVGLLYIMAHMILVVLILAFAIGLALAAL